MLIAFVPGFGYGVWFLFAWWQAVLPGGPWGGIVAGGRSPTRNWAGASPRAAARTQAAGGGLPTWQGFWSRVIPHGLKNQY